jgi:hypothetical protein
MQQRYVIHLVHRHADDKWHLQHLGRTIAAFETKEEAEGAGQTRAHRLWDVGTKSQLVIHRKDGSIEMEYTYGQDPSDVLG